MVKQRVETAPQPPVPRQWVEPSQTSQPQPAAASMTQARQKQTSKRAPSTDTVERNNTLSEAGSSGGLLHNNMQQVRKYKVTQE